MKGELVLRWTLNKTYLVVELDGIPQPLVRQVMLYQVVPGDGELVVFAGLLDEQQGLVVAALGQKVSG